MAAASNEEPGLGDVLARIPQSVRSSQIRNVDAVIAIRSLGVTPGDWSITIKDGNCTVSEGRPPSANVTVEAEAATWSALIRRQLDVEWAYMSGQLRVSGDLGLAMRLQSVLNL